MKYGKNSLNTTVAPSPKYSSYITKRQTYTMGTHRYQSRTISQERSLLLYIWEQPHAKHTYQRRNSTTKNATDASSQDTIVRNVLTRRRAYYAKNMAIKKSSALQTDPPHVTNNITTKSSLKAIQE